VQISHALKQCLALGSLCIYNNLMRITFDPAKRDKTLAERGLDFDDAALIFAGVTLELKIRARTTAKRVLSATECWKGGWSS
jgi:hypothetical protein